MADYYSGHLDHHGGQSNQQQQQQLELQRSLQASKQMVYGVFKNMIADLEEMERREHKQVGERRDHLRQSDLTMPSMDKKTDENVERITEAQLLIFQTQLNCCPAEIREVAQKELIHDLLMWSAARSDCKLHLTATDHYAAKLLEILETRKTSHPDFHARELNLTEEVVHETMSGFMIGQEKQKNLDKKFKDDSSRQAKRKEIREGQDIQDGKKRLQSSADPALLASGQTKSQGGNLTDNPTSSGGRGQRTSHHGTHSNSQGTGRRAQAPDDEDDMDLN